jgi:hypothetical protein
MDEATAIELVVEDSRNAWPELTTPAEIVQRVREHVSYSMVRHDVQDPQLREAYRVVLDAERMA